MSTSEDRHYDARNDRIAQDQAERDALLAVCPTCGETAYGDYWQEGGRHRLDCPTRIAELNREIAQSEEDEAAWYASLPDGALEPATEETS